MIAYIRESTTEQIVPKPLEASVSPQCFIISLSTALFDHKSAPFEKVIRAVTVRNATLLLKDTSKALYFSSTPHTMSHFFVERR